MWTWNMVWRIYSKSVFILQRLLVCNPTGRLSAEEGLQHGYFSDLSPSVKFPSDPYWSNYSSVVDVFFSVALGRATFHQICKAVYQICCFITGVTYMWSLHVRKMSSTFRVKRKKSLFLYYWFPFVFQFENKINVFCELKKCVFG